MKKIFKIIVISFLVMVAITAIAIAFSDTEEPKNEKNTQEVISSSDSDCAYVRAVVKAYRVGTNELLNDKTLNGCFTLNVDEMNLVEIKDNQGRLKVSFYKESNPKVIKMLNIKMGDSEPSEWRAKKGHDLFINEDSDKLSLIFGDRNKSKIKGTIEFYK